MHERFTDMARKVMQLSREEAWRLNHQYIGTEHILLGIARWGRGVAANVLKSLDVDLSVVRIQVEEIVGSEPELPIGYQPNGLLSQTPRAKRSLEYAIEESASLSHSYIGTEHLLLGLMREEEGVAFEVLRNLGVTHEMVRTETLRFLTQR